MPNHDSAQAFVPNPPGFRLGGEFEVRLDLGCLRRLSGEEVSLRPKTFETLHFLLQHRERVVGKDELTTHLWPDTAVTDDALVQCIVELRKALGDAAREPRYVKTLPKRGYRFVADVEVSAPARPPATTAIQRGWQIPVAVVAVALILIALFVRASVSGNEIALDAIAGKPGVVVMFLDNQSRAPDLDWMRQGLADMLITGLSRSDRMNVLGRRHLQHLMDRIGYAPGENVRLTTALDIARRSKATYVVLGSFARLGEKTRIDVQMQDRSGRTVATETLTVDRPAEVLTQVDLLAWRLARTFDAGLGRPPAAAAAGLTTNLDAFRFYSLGLSKAISYHNAEAIELFHHALDLDPDFVMARARIGYVYGVTWQHPDKALPYLTDALRDADRVRESDRLLIQSWLAIAKMEFAAAIPPLQRLIALYPYEIEAHARLARLLEGELRHDEALAVVRRGLEADPESGELFNRLGGIYCDIGRFAECLEACERFVALEPNEANSHDSLGLAYLAAGRYEEAEAAFNRALELKPTFDVALIHLANLRFQTGRYRSAAALFERYLTMARSDTERARAYSSLAALFARLRDEKRAISYAERADSLDGSTGAGRLDWNKWLIWSDLGLPLDAAPRDVHLAIPNRGARHSSRVLYLINGRRALQEGRAADAIEQFRRLLRENPLYWSHDSFNDGLAQGYLALGLYDEAVSEFERVLASNPSYPRAHYFLGLAQARRGNSAAASQAFKQFLQDWKGADADIPEVVEARTQLARLSN